MPFECLPNCGECCGIIPLDKALYQKHRHRAQVDPIARHDLSNSEVLPETKDGYCVFLDRLTRQCVIYHDRPEVCRRFGTSTDPGLACPYLLPSGKRRSRASRRQLERHTTKRMTNLIEIENPQS